MKKIVMFCILLSLSVISFSHPGKTNAKGCHTNKKTGVYHCHNSKTYKSPSKSTTQKPVSKKNKKENKEQKQNKNDKKGKQNKEQKNEKN